MMSVDTGMMPYDQRNQPAGSMDARSDSRRLNERRAMPTNVRCKTRKPRMQCRIWGMPNSESVPEASRRMIEELAEQSRKKKLRSDIGNVVSWTGRAEINPKIRYGDRRSVVSMPQQTESPGQKHLSARKTPSASPLGHRKG
jgi:hypothetical protein